MHIKQIKLSGFKSFVEPITIDFKSFLVGIVGPNGCGKSNVIDAVRWVMGESSAKHLRGESTVDVIFNGSNSRKPVGQASVELVFDNSDGGLGGEYTSYAEIVVKRLVTRDNQQSSYFLNNTRCRRRDIVDVFLGTGLSPRSYSIIEQGMISRVIEAKPENLRTFIEEAAGTALYKKRRHETNLRMQHTQENLARIEDVKEEQSRTLEKLKRQSTAALKFKEYEQEKNQLENQLLALSWQNFDSQLEIYKQDIQLLSNQLEELLAKRVNIDTNLEKLRLDRMEKNDAFNKVQAEYYATATEIARQEQTLQHHQDKEKQLTLDLEQATTALTTSSEQQQLDQELLLEINGKLEILEPKYLTAKTTCEASENIYNQAYQAVKNWNEMWEEFQTKAQEPQQQANMKKLKIEQLERQIQDAQVRMDCLQQEETTLQITELTTTKEGLSAELGELEEQAEQIKNVMQGHKAKISDLRNELYTETAELDEVKNSLQAAIGKLSSLKALQQAALNVDNSSTEQWLKDNNLYDLPRLIQQLEVEPGWELAVETVIADYLQAICVDSIADELLTNIEKLKAGNVTLLAGTEPVSGSPLGDTEAIKGNNHSGVDIIVRLISKIKSTVNNNKITAILNNTIVVEDIAAAAAILPQLQLNLRQSIITKDGIWLDDSWVKCSKAQADDLTSGVLQREQEIKQLTTGIEQDKNKVIAIEQTITEYKSQLEGQESNLEAKELDYTEINEQILSCSNKLSSTTAKYEHALRRKQNINEQIEDYKLQLSEQVAEANQARVDLEQAIESMAVFAKDREKLLVKKQELQNQEQQTKAELTQQKDKLHELAITREKLLTEVHGVQENIDRLNQQLIDLTTRQQSLQESLSKDLQPIDKMQQALESLLAASAKIEIEVQAAKSIVEDIDNEINDLIKNRNNTEKEISKLREQLDKLKLEWQSLEVRKQTVNEQVTEKDLLLEEIIKTLPEQANEQEWSENIKKLSDKINRLGAINLAAVQEYESELEREIYLQSQYQDLQEALISLESAIKKIDKDTRSKFKETFDAINANFKVLFPKLFAGGNAYLELVGDDLLQAGVTVMARPPGKKNSSIHLLSGGEKALTAVALVFSIFQLNSAPFCMLDEVDAPLDDANVGRFCQMLIEMSDKVQFIFITHNKITMEIAKQLTGVTMKEPGVSRLVSVDINNALAMAEA